MSYDAIGGEVVAVDEILFAGDELIYPNKKKT